MRVRGLCWIPALLLLGPPAAAASARCTLIRSAPLPVTLQGLSPIVAAEVNGARARFILDTGAPYEVLSPAAAAALKLPISPTGSYLRGIGGASAVSMASVRTFTLAGITFHDARFLVGGNELRAGVAGLLGANLLRLSDVELDLAQGTVRFIKPEHCGNEPLAYWAGAKPVSVIDLQWTPGAHHFEGTATLNGHSVRFLFDTGAARSVLSLEAAKGIGLSPGSPGVRPAGMLFGIGPRPTQAWIGSIALVQIGSEKIEHTHLLIAELNLPELDVDMLLGADFFLSHHVYIANSQNKVYFTYSGGPVFNLTLPHPKSAASTAAAGAPSTRSTDAPGLMRRALAEAAHAQFSRALADLDRACALDPTHAEYFLERAAVYLESGHAERGLSDLDTALRLRPDDAQALLLRAQARFALRRSADAKTWTALTAAAGTDLHAADRYIPGDSSERLALGLLYDQDGAFAPAIRALDAWIVHHGNDARLPVAWDGRCWARAASNTQLPKALKDCNRALDRMPGSTPVLDSRGLVDIRLGQFRPAIRDYDAALSAHPHRPLPRYGRGLAELRLGEKAAGKADLAAAEKINPGTARRYAQIGLAP